MTCICDRVVDALVHSGALTPMTQTWTGWVPACYQAPRSVVRARAVSVAPARVSHDYHHPYTSYGIRHVLNQAGFAQIDVGPMNDTPSTVDALPRRVHWQPGQALDGRGDRRTAVGDVLHQATTVGESLGAEWLMAVSFSATVQYPGETAG